MLLLFNKIIFLSLFISQAVVQFHTPTRFSFKSTAVDSFYVGSLTDEATGRFLVNMTNNFANTSYAVNYTGNAYAGESFPANVTCVAKFEYYSGGFETGAYDVVCYGGSALVDGKYNYTVAHGDLA